MLTKYFHRQNHQNAARMWQRFKRSKLAVLSLGFILLLLVCCFVLPYIYPYSFNQVHLGAENLVFSKQHWLGTDPLGRDLLIRNIYAARNALFVGVGAVGVGLLLGGIAGAFAGLRGGWIDILVMRLVDVFFAFPQFLIMVIAVTVLGKGLVPLFLAIGIVSWAGYARLIRTLVIQAREEPYVEAARCLGVGDVRLFVRHILPNIMGPIGVATTLGVPAAMMAESGMSLIGLGLRPPMPSWGNLITEGAVQILGYPHLVLYPAGFFAITLLAFAFLGDGLQEVYRRER